MGRPKSADVPIPWFSLDDYKFIHNLDPEGWSNVLIARQVCLQDFERKHTEDSKKDRLRYWERVYVPQIVKAKGNPFPAGQLTEDDDSSDQDDKPLELVKDFTDSSLDWIDLHRDLGQQVLVVDPTANDEALKNAFNHWLREARKETPLPTQLRHGKNKPPAPIRATKAFIQSFVTYNILAVFDLNHWTDVTGEKATKRQKAELIFRSSSDIDPEQRWRDAERRLDEALLSLNVLAYAHYMRD